MQEPRTLKSVSPQFSYPQNPASRTSKLIRSADVNSARSFGLPIYITEFGLDSTYSYTDAELQAFLEEVMPWMDQQDDILGYAYFMDEAGVLINSDGTGISGTGAVFNSYTNTTVQQGLY